MRRPLSTFVPLRSEWEAGPERRRAQATGSGGIGGAQAAEPPSTGRAPGVK